jgi:CRISPR system Cascade subunit CasD
MLSFGGVAIDHLGVTREFPAQSMLTGLIGNALGWDRMERKKHQRLQDAMVFAARIDHDDGSGKLIDVQNANLAKNDRGWTARGEPEGRDGDSYGGPHRRYREYHADRRVVVVCGLDVNLSQDVPSLEMIAVALDRPARPLFVGRKPCIPSAPILVPGFVEAPNAHDALCRVGSANGELRKMRAIWPCGDGPEDGAGVDNVHDLPDVRNWVTGLHCGVRKVVDGTVSAREVCDG